jgi:hypothetical protein
MDTIGFPTYLEFMKEERQSRCIDTDADLFCIVCGPERSGKSLVVAATCLAIDPSYSVDKVFYDGQKYTNLLLEASRARGLDYDRKFIEENNIMGLDVNEFLNPEKAKSFPPGSVLHYDEAGVGMSNRDSIKKESIDQYKTVQTMGHLRLVNFWCAPKLRVIDVYPREDRVKFFMWVDNMGTKGKPERYMFIWTKDSLNRMLVDPYWKVDMMLGTKRIVSKYKPDLRVYIPNLLSGDDPYIPDTFWKQYKIRKLMYDYQRLRSSQPSTSEDPMPLPGEPLRAYIKRTKKSKTTYYRQKEKLPSPPGNNTPITV